MKPKVLFVYDLENEHLWKDGLFAAVELLKQDFEVLKYNRQDNKSIGVWKDKYDFVLGWGGLRSPVAELLQSSIFTSFKKGLCLGGYALPTKGLTLNYDVLFYETEWSMDWLKSGPIQAFPQHQTCFIHAFGVNTNIYWENDAHFDGFGQIWDYITVGAFAKWKRQALLLGKEGARMAVGQIQKGNLGESIDIIGELLLGGCMVSDMVDPEVLANMYNASRTVYIPADIMGGGERAVLEARACGVAVEIEPDNPKLLELTSSPIWDHHYYAKKLKEGILSCV